jgi:hypothetical protein
MLVGHDVYSSREAQLKERLPGSVSVQQTNWSHGSCGARGIFAPAPGVSFCAQDSAEVGEGTFVSTWFLHGAAFRNSDYS